MVCKQCGAENADNVKFCSTCGARMEDDKVACKACGQMNAKDAVYCAFCGGRTDGKTTCSACGTVHEGKFCPNCGHAEGVAPAPAAAPAPAPAYAAAPVKQKKAPAPAQANGAMSTLQKIFSIVGSAVLMLGVLFAVIGLFGIGVTIKYESAAAAMLGGAETQTMEMNGLFYFFSDYAYNAYGITTAEQKAAVDAMGGLSSYISAMQSAEVFSGDYVTMVTMTQIFGIGISITTLALVVSFAIPAIIAFIKNLTGKPNNFGKWAILTIVMFFMGSGIIYGLNVYAMEEVAAGVTTSEYVYSFSGLTKVAIILGCIGIGVYVAAKLFISLKSWLNTKGILRVVFAVVAVVAIAFVFTAAKEAAVTVTTSEEGMGLSYSESYTMSFLRLFGSGEYDYVIVTLTDPMTGLSESMAMSTEEWYSYDMSSFMGANYDVNYVGDSIMAWSMVAQMFAIVVAILAAVALGKMLKNLWSEEKSGHLGISIVLLIFTIIYAVLAFVVKSNIDTINEALAGGETAVAAGAVLPEVSVTPIIIGAVMAVVNLGMAIAQKVVAPKPVAPIAPNYYGGYGVPQYGAPQAPQAPQNGYNNNNMSFGG